MRFPISIAGHRHDKQRSQRGEFQIPFPGGEELVGGSRFILRGSGQRFVLGSVVGRVRHVGYSLLFQNGPVIKRKRPRAFALAALVFNCRRFYSSPSPSSRPSRWAFRRSSRRLARSAARLTSSLPTSSIMACSAPSPLRHPSLTMRE